MLRAVMCRRHRQRSVLGFRAIAAIAVAGLSSLLCPWVLADDGGQYRSIAAIRAATALNAIEVSKDYALGINRFNLDGHTEILGWRLNHAWYFGRQDGLDSGLTLVWQQDVNQVSLSKDGLRLTRRF